MLTPEQCWRQESAGQVGAGAPLLFLLPGKSGRRGRGSRFGNEEPLRPGLRSCMLWGSHAFPSALGQSDGTWGQQGLLQPLGGGRDSLGPCAGGDFDLEVSSSRRAAGGEPTLLDRRSWPQGGRDSEVPSAASASGVSGSTEAMAPIGPALPWSLAQRFGSLASGWLSQNRRRPGELLRVIQAGSISWRQPA